MKLFEDEPVGEGRLCSKHKIGYISICPTCFFEKRMSSKPSGKARGKAVMESKLTRDLREVGMSKNDFI